MKSLEHTSSSTLGAALCRCLSFSAAADKRFRFKKVDRRSSFRSSRSSTLQGMIPCADWTRSSEPGKASYICNCPLRDSLGNVKAVQLTRIRGNFGAARFATRHKTPRAVKSPRQVCAKAAPPRHGRRLAIRNNFNHLSPFFTSSKLTMELEGVSASVLGPAPVGKPASKGGPQAEFHVTDRVSLLKTLKNALNTDIPPTAWACLWLSDIDKLKVLVDVAQQLPFVYLNYFRSIESEAKIVQKCEVYRL